MTGLLGDNYRLMQLLGGIGLLGSKRGSQADRYMKIATQGLLGRGEAERQAEKDKQSNELHQMKLEEARRLREGRNQFQELLGHKAGPFSQDLFPGEQPTPGLMNENRGLVGGQITPQQFATNLMGIPGYEKTGLDMFSAQQKAEADAPGKVFDKEKDLRKAYDDASKEYIKSAQAYNRVVASAKKPSPAGDMALIFNYMKVLDPGSTVREGEYATAKNAGNWSQNIRAMYNSAIDGTLLTHPQRADFVTRAGNLYQGAREIQNTVDDRYRALAGSYGVSSDNILYNPELEIYEYPPELLTESESQKKQTRQNKSYKTLPGIQGRFYTFDDPNDPNAEWFVENG